MARIPYLERVNIGSNGVVKSISSDRMGNILKRIRLNFGKSYECYMYKFSESWSNLSRDFQVMSFPSPSTIFGRSTRRSAFHWSWLNTRHVRCLSMAEAHAESLVKQTTEVVQTTKPTLESLGLGDAFIRALKMAYPNVICPTDTQTQLIPAILGTQDIVVKDVTRSGKCVVFFFSIFDLVFVLNLLCIRSFGLMLGLINKPGLVSKEWRDGKSINKRHISTILLVHHRDLAFQLYRIVTRITRTLPKTRAENIAYVLVRGTGVPIPQQILRLEATPPHILICTPKSLLDVYRRNSSVLQLSTLSTVAVDDVDYLIEPLPKNPNKAQEKPKHKHKLVKHPGLTRQFLDVIYSKRRKLKEQGYSSEETDGEKKTPQLILISAMIHVPLKNFFYEQKGWLDKDNVFQIIKNDERTKSDKKKKVKKAGNSEVTGERGRVLHSALGVSENVVEARDGPELKRRKDEEETKVEAEATEAEVDEPYDESKQGRMTRN